MSTDGAVPCTIFDVPFTITLECDATLTGVNMLEPQGGVDPDYELSVDISDPHPQTRLLRWRLRRRDGASFQVKGFNVQASVPGVDLHRMWVPALNESIGKSDMISLPWGIDERSFVSWSFPFIAALSRQDINRFAIGFMDHIETAAATHNCYDEDAKIGLSRLYEDGPMETTAWEETLYVSRTPVHLFDQVRQFARTYDQVHQPVLCETPDAVWKPVWCSWYGIKNDVTAEYVLDNAPHLQEMGFGSVIVDAGWWVDGHVDEATGHYKANEKFPDMPGMAARLNERDLRVLLWCAPLFHLDAIRENPFISKHMLKSVRPGVPGFLCPRCQPVHDYVRRMVEHIIRENGVDGLKIDFIDAGAADLSYACTADHEHDYPTYGQAMEALLRTIHEAAKGVRSDALLEFRMNYTNLVTRSYATSHRAQDSPLDFDHIRRMCTRLRSYMIDPEAGREGNVAVHADPAWWQPRDGAEIVACFMSSLVTSAVPMLSTDMRDLGAETRAIIKAWLGFYNERTDLIMFGRHRVLGTDPHHSIFSVHREGEAVIGIYTAALPGQLEMPDPSVRRLWILNGSGQDRLFARLTGIAGGVIVVNRYSRALELQESQSMPVFEGGAVLDLRVDIGGALELRVS